MAPPGFIYQHLSRFTLDSPPVSYKPLTTYLQPAGARAQLQSPGPGEQADQCQESSRRVLTGAKGTLQGSVPCAMCLQAL